MPAATKSMSPAGTISLRLFACFVALDHCGDHVVQARCDKAQPLNVSNKKVDVSAEPVLEPEHQNGASAEDKVWQIELPGL